MKLLIGIAMVVLFWAANAGAGCKEDCDRDFRIATQDCQTKYNNPENKDPDQLQECLDEAEDRLKSCREDCKDEWGTHGD